MLSRSLTFTYPDSRTLYLQTKNNKIEFLSYMSLLNIKEMLENDIFINQMYQVLTFLIL